MFVIFWAETSLHNGIAGQVTEVLRIADNITELGPEVYQLMNDVTQIDNTRWAGGC